MYANGEIDLKTGCRYHEEEPWQTLEQIRIIKPVSPTKHFDLAWAFMGIALALMAISAVDSLLGIFVMISWPCVETCLASESCCFS